MYLMAGIMTHKACGIKKLLFQLFIFDVINVTVEHMKKQKDISLNDKIIRWKSSKVSLLMHIK